MTAPNRDELTAAASRWKANDYDEMLFLLPVNKGQNKIPFSLRRHNDCVLLADAYLATQAADELFRLRDENERMKRGEFICSKCGLRHDSDESNQPVDF